MGHLEPEQDGGLETWREGSSVLGNPRDLWLPGGRRARGAGESKRGKSVARDREAEIRRVCPGHMAAWRKDTSTGPRHPPWGRSRPPTLTKLPPSV